MKRLIMGLVVAATFATAGTAFAQVNKTCPVKQGTAAKSDITFEFDGKVIGFC